MRENRQSGSAGGEAGTNRPSLPRFQHLSVQRRRHITRSVLRVRGRGALDAIAGHPAGGNRLPRRFVPIKGGSFWRRSAVRLQ